ncbi:MAG: hypothetical protein HY717_19015 [Planctomycetes bacterium]|nr:hypothetical protein [Planctomycetota bacterium]
MSPDSKHLATIFGGAGAWLWNVATTPSFPFHGMPFPAEASYQRADFSPDGKFLALGTSDGTIRLHRLPRAPEELWEMKLRTWVALGTRQDRQGNLEVIPWYEWRLLKEELASLETELGSGDFPSPLPEDSAKSHPDGLRCLQSIRSLNLARKLSLSGQIPGARKAYASAFTVLENIAADSAMISRHFPELLLGHCLLLHEEAGNLPEAEKALDLAAGTMEGLEAEPGRALVARIRSPFASACDRQAQRLLAGPDPEPHRIEQALFLADLAARLAPDQSGHWRTRGIARCRAGDWKAGAEALEKALSLGSSEPAREWLFLAMASWRLGKESQAREFYRRAAERLERQKAGSEDLLHLRAEAEALFSPTNPPAGPIGRSPP